MKKAFFLLLSLFFICTCPVVAADAKSTASAFSGITDYYRSAMTGNWGALTTWESSPDNGVTPWAAATLIPTSAANTIYIRNTHTVTVTGNQDMDQVIIESGGILLHASGMLTVNDGAGDDIIVQSGGIFTLASSSNAPAFLATATANINTGGILRLSATGLTAAGTGVHANNFIYQHASVLEYTLTNAFSTAAVTFFPNVNASTIPVFRITANVVPVGANSFTTINGLFEANGNITFQNTGTKTFRNGITGTGNVTGDPLSGKFTIDGNTADLGGSGLLTLPATGMDIGSNTTVAMVSNKTVTGNIALQSNALVTLGSYNLTITGDVSGGSATSHVVTDGTGKLVINAISGAAPRRFPVGANTTTINELEIFNGGGFNYGVRVETGINPTIAVPVSAVNRTWFVTPVGGTPATVNTNFFYYPGDGNGAFNYSANLELGLYTGVWNVIQTGLVPTGTYQVATTVTGFGNNIESPLVLANLGAILASSNAVAVNYFTGTRQNNDHILHWKLTCNSTPHVNIALQRSDDGIHFIAVENIYATALYCEQPFDYTDDRPLAGTNYYRIKLIDADGKIYYSSIVSLINAIKGFSILPVMPNPVVNGKINLKISTAKNTQIQLQVYDLQGRILQKQSVSLFAGTNSVLVNVSQLSAGIYCLAGNIADEGIKVVRFAVQ